MLGVGKAAPAQFILRGKTNLRRISAAGQKAGFTAYPSHWASIWWDVIGGQCIFFANARQLVASFVPLATSFWFQKIHHALAPLLLLSKCGPLRWAHIWCERGHLPTANVPFRILTYITCRRVLRWSRCIFPAGPRGGRTACWCAGLSRRCRPPG